MNLMMLLHFYQPYNQRPDILDRIVNESYLPVTQGLLDRPQAKAIININGSLLNLLKEHGHMSIIDNIRQLMKNGQVEVTSSAMYHALLPLIDEAEIQRQINLHNETSTEFFGDAYKPSGFFSPEMAINDKLLNILARNEFKWTCVPQIASTEYKGPQYIYVDEESKLKVFFRNKRVSSLVLSSVVKDSADLLMETQDIHEDNYWFLVMDVETFGHHRIGHEHALFDILENSSFNTTYPKEYLSNAGIDEIEVPLRACTWTNREQDFFVSNEKGSPNSFILWDDPTNPIHQAQWELTNLVVDVVNSYPNKNMKEWEEARTKLDYAIASDQFWWASAKPWWSLEMIELGAFTLKSIVESLDVKQGQKDLAMTLYRKIVDRAFEWHRTGYVDKVHQQHSPTYKKKSFREREHLEWYNQMILEFEDQMNIATRNKNFEQAVKWRDAVIKIRNGNDVFDILHVIDELWSARQIPSVKPFFDHEYEEFTEFAKQHFLGFKTREEFEEWKESKIRRYWVDENKYWEEKNS